MMSEIAMQGLNVETLKAGQRILIHAGSGGVGHMAIQLAKLKGLYVITTASTRNHQFLKVCTSTAASLML